MINTPFFQFPIPQISSGLSLSLPLFSLAPYSVSSLIFTSSFSVVGVRLPVALARRRTPVMLVLALKSSAVGDRLP